MNSAPFETVEARRRFLEQYAIVRHAEGRGSDDAGYYKALPYVDKTGANGDQWRIRARSFEHFLRRVILPAEKTLCRPMDVIDLGAGNGWLSQRLRDRGHHAVAVDIFADDRDGLGAIRKYSDAEAVMADFDRLPFEPRQFDVAIYNASLHYSRDYARTLGEARRCLRPQGQIVILDSPVYQEAEHGERMKRERREIFERRYGFPSDALDSIEYLDEDTLKRLARELGIAWERSKAWYGWKWALRPAVAKLRGKRPPSRFYVIAGRFV